MRMKAIRQVKTIDYLNSTLFDEQLSHIFNDDSIRIIDIQFRIENINNEIHYIAFIVYEYLEPDNKEELYVRPKKD